jgi:hypothetical protein
VEIKKQDLSVLTTVKSIKGKNLGHATVESVRRIKKKQSNMLGICISQEMLENSVKQHGIF